MFTTWLRVPSPHQGCEEARATNWSRCHSYARLCGMTRCMSHTSHLKLGDSTPRTSTNKLTLPKFGKTGCAHWVYRAAQLSARAVAQCSYYKLGNCCGKAATSRYARCPALTVRNEHTHNSETWLPPITYDSSIDVRVVSTNFQINMIMPEQQGESPTKQPLTETHTGALPSAPPLGSWLDIQRPHLNMTIQPCTNSWIEIPTLKLVRARSTKSCSKWALEP